jgi:copper(I)-binding protein
MENDMSRLSLSAWIVLAGLFTASAVSAGEDRAISVDNAWSRATPEGAAVAAGYATITNEGAEPDCLVSASADITEKTEIHQMNMVDGMMQMRPVPGGLPIPTKSSVKLEPGGYHLMFLTLTRPLKEGDAFPGTLNFERAGEVKVTFQVLGMGAQAPEHHHH